jgi:hypothetical protein
VRRRQIDTTLPLRVTFYAAVMLLGLVAWFCGVEP